MKFNEFLAKRQHIINTAVITVDGVDLLIKDIPDGTFTLEQYKASRGNSDAWRLIVPKLDNEALIYMTEHYIDNCSPSNTITYDGALKRYVVPELLKRLERRQSNEPINKGSKEITESRAEMVRRDPQD